VGAGVATGRATLRWWLAVVPLIVPIPVAAQAPGGNEDPAMQQMMTAADQNVNDEQARAHFEAGRSLYAAGRFQLAAQEFEEAFRLSDRAELLYNAYVAYRDANDQRKSAEMLESFLARMPGAPDRITLEARLRALQEAIAREDAIAAERAAAPPRSPAEPQQGVAPPPDPVDGEGGSVLPFIVLGLGGAVLIAGATTGVIALGKTSDIENNCPANACEFGFDLAGARDDARMFATLTDVLLLSGAALAVTGAVLFFVLPGSGEAEQPNVGAACTTDGCLATGRLRF